jgi:hypothetical protein
MNETLLSLFKNLKTKLDESSKILDTIITFQSAEDNKIDTQEQQLINEDKK